MSQIFRSITHQYIQRCGLVIIIALVTLYFSYNESLAGPQCTVSMTSINFGSFGLSGSSIDVTGTLSLDCKSFPASGAIVCMNIDAGSSGDATSRFMLGPSSLRFDLYSDASRTTIWGSWQTGYKSPGVAAVVANGITNFTVYGRVFGSQSVPPGSYSSSFVLNPYVHYTRVADGGSCPGPLPGQSGTTSASFTASATVLASCTVSATSMNFGTINFLNSNVDATATVSPNCSSGTPYSISLSNGNTGTGPTTRKMVNGGNSVTYGLYQDGSRSQPWGDTIGTNTVGGTGNGSAQPITVYGRVPPQTTPQPATYADTVVVTVTY